MAETGSTLGKTAGEEGSKTGGQRLRFRLAAIAMAGFLAACGSSSPPVSEAQKVALPKPPHDESRRFPSENQVSMKLIPDKLLGHDFLPGGNLAEYAGKGGKTYQQFLIKADNNIDAPIWLIDWKEQMTDAQTIAYMGGYFGQDHGQPVYVFVKGSYLVGFVGLPMKDADVLARQFAARIY